MGVALGGVPLDCHDFTSCPYPYCKDDVRNMHEDLYQHGHPVVHLWPFFPANDPHDSWPFMWKIWSNLTPTMAKLKEKMQMFVVKFPSKFLCNKFTVSWILPWNYSSEVFFVHRFSMQQLWIRIATCMFSHSETWWPLRVERSLSFEPSFPKRPLFLVPIGSMYGIFGYIWLIFMVNVGKYTIHGSYGVWVYNQTIPGNYWYFEWSAWLTGWYCLCSKKKKGWRRRHFGISPDRESSSQHGRCTRVRMLLMRFGRPGHESSRRHDVF